MADDTLMDLIDAYAEARHVGGCHTYNAKTADARAKVVASLAASAGSEAVAAIYQLSPPASAHDTITEVIKELRTYNPQADEHGGRFIHKGWANQLEAVAPPQISESGAAYWVRNRALILRAIEERGFRLVSSGGLFWLSGPSHPSPPEGMAWWISVDKRLPEAGVTVLVYEPFRHGEDWPGTVRISFDHICPDYEGWHDHCASYEHFMAVGGVNACGPDVTCVGPSEKAPYTHWMPLPAPPLPASEAKEL